MLARPACRVTRPYRGGPIGPSRGRRDPVGALINAPGRSGGPVDNGPYGAARRVVASIVTSAVTPEPRRRLFLGGACLGMRRGRPISRPPAAAALLGRGLAVSACSLRRQPSVGGFAASLRPRCLAGLRRPRRPRPSFGLRASAREPRPALPRPWPWAPWAASADGRLRRRRGFGGGLARGLRFATRPPGREPGRRRRPGCCRSRLRAPGRHPPSSSRAPGEDVARAVGSTRPAAGIGASGRGPAGPAAPRPA